MKRTIRYIGGILHCLSYFLVDDSDLLVMGKPCYKKWMKYLLRKL